MDPIVSERRYLSAPRFEAYLEEVEKNRKLWHGIHERADVPEEVLEEAHELPTPVRLLALSEDWCGDAVNTLPVVARLAERLAGWELRVLSRDENPDLMDAHLTGGSRSIPVVMVLDEELREMGWWGPRPAELQEWMLGEGRELESPERYRRARRWYAVDGGRTVLEELLEVVADGIRDAAA